LKNKYEGEGLEGGGVMQEVPYMWQFHKTTVANLADVILFTVNLKEIPLKRNSVVLSACQNISEMLLPTYHALLQSHLSLGSLQNPNVLSFSLLD
jgi:hypothetical protein